MQLHKIPHPGNFEFVRRVTGRGPRRSASVGDARLRLEVRDEGDEIFQLRCRDERWREPLAPLELTPPGGSSRKYELSLDAEGALVLGERGAEGRVLLEGAPGATLGLSGSAWMLRFVPEAGERFYGMGEKWGPLERSGQKSQFWNTDVWADFAPSEIVEARIDATYASIPYLIVRRGGVFFGVLVDSAFRVFCATNPGLRIDGSAPEAPPVRAKKSRAERATDPRGHFYLGASDGAPSVYFIVGPSLRELTEKLQRLVGTTPRPPLWALGHHQSRWGYGTERDLEELDRRFSELDIPCDGLWLDIDYMDGFRVFTLAPEAFTGAKAAPSTRARLTRAEAASPQELPALAALRARGRRIVPILDPGVKVEPGYSIYEEGLSGGHFCLSPSGRPYVGIVWPGETHFPDFSRAETRAFWAKHTARLAARGFDGFWIDMNDPSTGPVESGSMLFDQGRRDHGSFHNQYALGMARATRAGLLSLRPEERPFVLSRSGSTTMARYAALWTGDNLSSFKHLASSIPVSLNLALSGVPFNGADVPGFGHDATDELCERWYQAAFLFPFLRNHSASGTRRQEPWQFSRRTSSIARHFIQLRYRFLPYLYQGFIAQEERGQALLAPVFYEDSKSAAVQGIEDEFLVGPSLLQAPVVEPGQHRVVTLPRGEWFCLRTGERLRGPARLELRVPRAETPLYAALGSVLPLVRRELLPGLSGTRPELLRELELHVFLGARGRAELVYEYDDGLSFGYRAGQLRRIRFEFERRGTTLQARAEDLSPPGSQLPGLGKIRVVDWSRAARFIVKEGGGRDGAKSRAQDFAPLRTRWTGAALRAGSVEWELTLDDAPR